MVNTEGVRRVHEALSENSITVSVGSLVGCILFLLWLFNYQVIGLACVLSAECVVLEG